MPPAGSKSKSASQIAHYQKRQQALGRKQTATKANDLRPSNDDPRLDQNISLEEQRARLEAELESEADAGTISSLRGQIDVLDRREEGGE